MPSHSLQLNQQVTLYRMVETSTAPAHVSDAGAPEKLRVDRHDDRACGHEDRANRGRQEDALAGQDSRRERNGYDVVPCRPPEVLDHLAVARPRKIDDPRYVADRKSTRLNSSHSSISYA